MKSKGALMPQGALHNGVSNQNEKCIGTHCGEQRHQLLLNHHHNKWRGKQQISSTTRRHRRSRHATPFLTHQPLRLSSPSLSSSLYTFISCLVLVITSTSLINYVYCDDGSPLSIYNLGPEITTTEFDYAGRGTKKFGDTCDSTWECGFPNSICDKNVKKCQCEDRFQATNHIDKCGKLAAINESCFFLEQCEMMVEQTECRDGRCRCMFEMNSVLNKDNTWTCVAEKDIPPEQIRYVDPTMILILVVMALMFIIICIVLRLFSRARWRENRTIFNTPNPRLMNVSLLRENKLLHERRGSRMSVRMPSRQPSMSSLRPHSPNASIGSRRGSRGSGASATSARSKSVNHHSNGHHSHKNEAPVQTNVVQNADSVTVEISEVKT